MIEIYVRSFSTYMDVETCRDMVQHPYCAPGTTEGLVSEAVSKFEGRLLPQEDSAVLEHVLQILDKTNESVKVYDLSTVTDNMRAMRHGIRKTPVVLINGKKYESLEEILKVLSTMKQSRVDR